MKYAEFTRFPSQNRFVRWKRSIASRSMAITRRCFRILVGNKRPRMHVIPSTNLLFNQADHRMQFKVVPSQSRLHEFRTISHGCIYIYIYNIYARVCVCIHIYSFSISLFRKSPLIHIARKRGCRATEIRRLRGLVRGEMQKISKQMESRWKKGIPPYYRDIRTNRRSFANHAHNLFVA